MPINDINSINTNSDFTFYKVFLPFCDDERCKGATIYLGNKKQYYSPAYYNSNGRQQLDTIKKIIGK